MFLILFLGLGVFGVLLNHEETRVVSIRTHYTRHLVAGVDQGRGETPSEREVKRKPSLGAGSQFWRCFASVGSSCWT